MKKGMTILALLLCFILSCGNVEANLPARGELDRIFLVEAGQKLSLKMDGLSEEAEEAIIGQEHSSTESLPVCASAIRYLMTDSVRGIFM